MIATALHFETKDGSFMITAMSHGQVLDEFGFKRVGEFTLTVDFLKYSCDDSYSGGQVYAFVFHRADGERDIVYLGKAGKGVATRLAQHMAGMKGGSKGGHEAASLFREWLASGRAISIWSRVSQAIDVFGIRVTLEDAEETSFLAQITPPPLRNRLTSLIHEGAFAGYPAPAVPLAA